MKTFFTIIMILISNAGLAYSPTTNFYIGQAFTTSSRTGEVTRSPYIVTRTMDPMKGTISESVVSKDENTYSENFSVMTIVGNHFTMTESTGTVEGDGELIGKSWEWTFLRGEFRMNTPAYNMRIVDYNFFADPNSLTGHKDFYLKLPGDSQEQLIQQEDVVLHETTEEEFKAMKLKLLGLNLTH